MRRLPLLLCSVAASTLWMYEGGAFAQDATPAKPAAASKPDTSKQVATTNSDSGIDPEKEKAIRRMFEVIGTRKAIEEVLAGMSGNIRSSLISNLPPGDYRERLADLFIQKLMPKFQIQQMMDMSVPVYAKYFTKEEIDGLTAFYQTPLGKKASTVMPQALLEIQTASVKMGEKLGRETMIEVLDEHPEMKKAIEDASAAPRN